LVLCGFVWFFGVCGWSEIFSLCGGGGGGGGGVHVVSTSRDRLCSVK